MKRRLLLLFGKNGRSSAKGQHLPGLHSASIYSHIMNHLDLASGRLSETGVSLPDEARRYADSKIHWAPGAMDGAFGHHFGANNNQDLARTIAAHVVRIANDDSQQDKISLYTLLLEDNLLDFVAPALEEIAHSGISPYPYLHPFATFLAKESPDRGPVKFAIAVLGFIGLGSDKETVSVLGRHEEFTLYAALALANMLDEPETELWQLAQKVDGWGRIHLVERLASASSPQIKDWLLRSGFRNSIMYEYLAYACATGGGLKIALLDNTVDDELLDGAGEIVGALIAEGPMEDINDYADAAVVVSRYLHHLESRAPKLQHFVVVDSIVGYLTSENWISEERVQNGWSDELRAAAIEKARKILSSPQWLAIVEQGLVSADSQQFYLADQAANALGMNTWDVHWSRLQQNPRESHLWYPIMQRANHDNIDRIVGFAVDVLPLDQVTTGAADELGLGPKYKIHRCLDTIVQDLGKYPTVGWPVIATCLRSPVVRNRNMAIRAIAGWGRDNWTAEIEQALVQARAVEPQTDVKERIVKVLQGEPFD